MKIGIITSITAVALSASAQQLPPRGPDILSQASACGIGPFPQMGKAGPYNPLCTTLTDAEKCLALIKDQMSNDGVVTPVYEQDNERVDYCLKHLAEVLIK